MTTSPVLQLVHESETQRQHVRLPFPARVEIDGKTWPARNLSSGGFCIEGIEGSYKRGEKIPVTLKIAFESFSLNLHAETSVQHYHPVAKILGCRFEDLAQDQISLLNQMLKSFMAGETVTASQVLHINARQNFTKARPKEMAPETSVPRNRIATFALIALTGLAASAVILSNLYDSIFVIRAADAYVSGPALELRAVTDGYYVPLLGPQVKTVRQGQVLARLQPPEGGAMQAVEIKSPCECYIDRVFRNNGEFIKSGEKLASLLPLESAPWIVARVDSEQAGRISLKQKATISVLGTNKEFAGSVEEIKSGQAPTTPESTPGYFPQPVQLRIVPDQKMPVEFFGRPAHATFSLR